MAQIIEKTMKLITNSGAKLAETVKKKMNELGSFNFDLPGFCDEDAPPLKCVRDVILWVAQNRKKYSTATNHIEQINSAGTLSDLILETKKMMTDAHRASSKATLSDFEELEDFKSAIAKFDLNVQTIYKNLNI